jgi:hypothetical protein
MPKLTDFGWQRFLGKLSTETVILLGEEWNIPEWQKADKSSKKHNYQDIKNWIEALNSKSEDELIELVDKADQIRTVGCPAGREEIITHFPSDWYEKNSQRGDEDLAALAYLEHHQNFREALSWLEIIFADRWEYYKADNHDKMNLSQKKLAELKTEIGNYWKEKGLGKKCIITSMNKDSINVIEIGYEQEPIAFRVFPEEKNQKDTVLKITKPVRDALIFYDSSKGDLQVRMYRGNCNKFDYLVRLVGEICFDNADLFPTGAKRDSRYDISKFAVRPGFLKDIDESTSLKKVIVTDLLLEPPHLKGGRIEAKIPAAQADNASKDAYDVLGEFVKTDNWIVKKATLKAYFENGKRKILPIEITRRRSKIRNN